MRHVFIAITLLLCLPISAEADMLPDGALISDN